MKRIMTSLLAAGVLVAAAVVVVAVGGSAADAQEPPPPPAPRWQLEDSEGAPFGYQRGFGTGGGGYLMGEIWEDGIIDAEELESLPEGHPLTDPDGPAGPYLEGGITAEEHELIRAECDGANFEARAEWRAERWADRQAFRAQRQGNFEARAELRAQHQAECAADDDCPFEPQGPGFFGRGNGRGGPNV